MQKNRPGLRVETSLNQQSNFNVCIVGAGIVGLATAYQIHLQMPSTRIVVLEKESSPALHQSGRNSGVLHTGIYYKPGSIKAETCRNGKTAMKAFCRENDVSFERCGKVIVATSESEVSRLDRIVERAALNGVDCDRIDPHQLAQIEPHARGVAALNVPGAGIVDYPAVCRRLVERLKGSGHQVNFDWKVQHIERRPECVDIRSSGANKISAHYVINCAGLYSDHVIRMAGDNPPARIVPFRGEYYELTQDARHLCRHLIYPVPDPSFPFLGVHFTRMVSSGVECGPNAVLAMAREGYNWRTVRIGELADSLTYRGFQRLAWKHWRMGVGEVWRSLSKGAFVSALQKLVPEIRSEHLRRCPAGVRAQALTKNGTMVDDFLIQTEDRVTHVCNAPSPAATSAFAIGEHISKTVFETAG